MPVSLDEMMREVAPGRAAAIERDASVMAADFRRRADQAEAAASSTRAAVGLKATTGQLCPESGIWKVENSASATTPIAVHTMMPPYRGKAVNWVLVQHA